MVTIDNLSEENCINLPSSGTQWFLINHRDDGLDGQTGYFSIRILYQSGSTDRDYIRQGIHIQRNGNWYDEAGHQIKAGHERNPEQIKLSGEQFISLHDPRSGKEASNLAALVSNLGAWHIKPTLEEETSWTDRYLYGATLKAYASDTTGAISARLIRFTATSSSSSGEPVLFWIDPCGAESALILVDAPRHEYQGSRRVYQIKFGGTCS